ncbi:MAG: hypothetical protein WB988_01505 [Candidatus Nitrosopolaris sp.]|jgi:hypothetical protein
MLSIQVSYGKDFCGQQALPVSDMSYQVSAAALIGVHVSILNINNIASVKEERLIVL